MASLASLLPNLEPILGAAFALNLAYIGLERFRYRKKIREYARVTMGDLAVNPPSHFPTTSVYKSVHRLANLGDNERKLFQKSKNGDLTGKWSGVYEYLFECHQDRGLAVAAAFLSVAGLTLGVAHNIGITWLDWAFSTDWISYWFWLNVFFLALPVTLVGLGRYAVAGAQTFADKQVFDLTAMLQKKVEDAGLPAEALQSTALVTVPVPNPSNREGNERA